MFALRRRTLLSPLLSTTIPPTRGIMAQKRAFNEGKRHFKKNKKQKTSSAADGSNEEVLLVDVRQLLQDVAIPAEKRPSAQQDADEHAEVDVTIAALSSTGDGLAELDGVVYVVPFSAPGDVVRARPYRHFPGDSYSLADFVSRVATGPASTAVPQCQYFTQCSGCQFQHMPYDAQLAHKKTIVEKAFRNFSNLPPESLPPVGDTIGSPLQYGYRTKLTPHFDGPPGGRRDKRHGKLVTWPGVPPIGFMKKGTRKTMDIEDCPIGTEAVRMGMKRERARVAKDIDRYQKGATLLLRESTTREEKAGGRKTESGEGEGEGDGKGDSPQVTTHPDEVVEDRGQHIHRKTCITDHKATSTEYVDDYRFDNPAGAFFQNNNSILPIVTQYIRDQILGASPPTTSDPTHHPPTIKHMVDAYCGSGFFTINLSSMFTQSIGIDVSAQSVDFASKNAALNHLPADATHFIAADASKLFESLDTQKFPPDETVVVIDPSRKGCDEGFISQLLAYGPARVCYVSCNVHTQARDVGWLVGGLPGGDDGEATATTANVKGGLYEIESLRGFDFFPQTSHVEGVAILRRKKSTAETGKLE